MQDIIIAYPLSIHASARTNIYMLQPNLKLAVDIEPKVGSIGIGSGY